MDLLERLNRLLIGIAFLKKLGLGRLKQHIKYTVWPIPKSIYGFAKENHDVVPAVEDKGPGSSGINTPA